MIKALLITLLTATLAHAQYDPISADYLRAWRIGAAGAGLWTPADLGDDLALWLDANDSSTLWEDTSATTAATNNGLVARWDDKSGNDVHFTLQSGDSSPTWTESSYLRFSGVLRQRLAAEPIASPSAYWRFMHYGDTTFYSVWRPSESAPASNYRGTLMDNSGGGSGRGFITAIDNRSASGFTRRLQSSSFASHTDPIARYDQNNAITDASSDLIYGVSLSNLAAVSNRVPFVRFDGNAVAWTNASSNTAVDANSNRGMFVGQQAAPDGIFPLNGRIYEIVITTNVISTESAQKIEGYLAHKWGLTANLPSDHPYKSSAPTK